MSNIKKLMMSAAGGDAINIEDIFSVTPYVGNGSTGQTITTGIDVSTEGGLILFKNRQNGGHSAAFDPQKYPNGNYWIYFNEFYGAQNIGENIFSASTTGFSFAGGLSNSGNSSYNASSNKYISYTFRKAPKFFDAITFTGDGQDGRQIAHNLGQVPGMIAIKAVSASEEWIVWHRSSTNVFRGFNNNNGANTSQVVFANTAPTASNFTLDYVSSSYPNTSGREYVAYLWAHNNNDGGFGPDQDQDVIKCGSYTGNGSGDGPTIDLGFEPEFVLIKRESPVNSTDSWILIDTVRGFEHGRYSNDNKTRTMYLDTTSAEINDTLAKPISNGFQIKDNSSKVNSSGDEYVYMAIRRGPMAVPENASDVFAVDAVNTSSEPNYVSGFPVDFLIEKSTGGSNTRFYDRMRGQRQLYSDNNWAEGTGRGSEEWDWSNGVKFVNSNYYYCWMWRRAPHFMDTVMYEGDGQNPRYVNHSLGVMPRMIWIKQIDSTENWYHWSLNSDGTEAYWNSHSNAFGVNTTGATSTNYTYSNALSLATATNFRPRQVIGGGGNTNTNGQKYCAWLFGSLDGISKVGSYTGNGSFQTIDCGFSSSSRFVLIKRIDSTGDWYFWDTERGLTQAADPYLKLNSTNAEITGNKNYVYPANSGFGVQEINGTNNPNINVSSAKYLFYAVAV